LGDGGASPAQTLGDRIGTTILNTWFWERHLNLRVRANGAVPVVLLWPFGFAEETLRVIAW
jgi:hypothetical protein